MAGAAALRLDIEDEIGVRASVRGKHVSGAEAPVRSAIRNAGTEVPAYHKPFRRSVSAVVRAEVEGALARRIPGALTPQPKMVRPVVGTGIAAVDEVVGGGVPLGAVTEVVGVECSGRTSLALSVVAQVMREGKVCAWVDASDALSPESAAAAGVDLRRLLWVRCGVVRNERQSAWAGFQVPEKYFVAPPAKKGLHGGGFGMHPRDEERGMGDAVGGLLEPRCAEAVRKVRMDGTVGQANFAGRAGTSAAKAAVNLGASYGTAEAVPLSKTVDLRGGPGEVVESTAEKHVSGAKAPPDDAGVNAGTEVPAYQKRSEASAYRTRTFVRRRKPWDRMDQALRAMDLLLQAGGFGAVVLDLGSMAPEQVSRIPLATWFRYRAAAERTQACVVLVTQYPCAKSSAELVLRMEKGVIRTQGGRVMTGFERRVEVVRRRFESGGAEQCAVGKDGFNVQAFSAEQGVTSAAEAVPLSKTVGLRGGPGAIVAHNEEQHVAGAKAPVHFGPGNAGTEVPAYQVQGSVVGMKKPVQRAGVGVWESRPVWAVKHG